MLNRVNCVGKAVPNERARLVLTEKTFTSSRTSGRPVVRLRINWSAAFSSGNSARMLIVFAPLSMAMYRRFSSTRSEFVISVNCWSLRSGA